MAPFVRIKLVGTGVFAELDFAEGETVERLTKRACDEFKSWAADAAQVQLFLVSEERAREISTGSSVVDADFDHPLHLFASLTEARIVSGSCILARIAASGESILPSEHRTLCHPRLLVTASPTTHSLTLRRRAFPALSQTATCPQRVAA